LLWCSDILRLIYDEAVMVKVGPDTDTATSFIMMNGVLEYHSPCFKAAFTRVFAEALKKETVFTTIEFDVFRAFRSWLYTHQIYFEEYANVARGAGSLAGCCSPRFGLLPICYRSMPCGIRL